MQEARDARRARALAVSALLAAALWLPFGSRGEETGQVAESRRQVVEDQGQGAGDNKSAAGATTPEPGESRQHPRLNSMPLLASDEPTTLGWTRDSYERQGFMDFTLSMRYPLFYDALKEGYRYNMLPFFSFTGRMGQYFGRHSAPVVAKRFNPKLLLRFYASSIPEGEHPWSDDNVLDYYDIGYAHESDGQHVDSPALFAAAVASYGSPEIAQDYMSRGWDYLDYKRHLQMHKWGLDSLDAEAKYFLHHGLLQATSEEYNYWEGPRSIIHISQVDGLRLKLNFGFHRDWFKGASLLLITGYRDLGRHDTVRAELGFTPLSDFLGVPIVLWGQTGYLNNVAQYYRRAWAVGIAAAFETFQ